MSGFAGVAALVVAIAAAAAMFWFGGASLIAEWHRYRLNRQVVGMMATDTTRWWTVQDTADHLGTDLAVALATLHRLERQQVVAQTFAGSLAVYRLQDTL